MGSLLSLLTFGYLAKKDEAKAVSQQIDMEIIREFKNEPGNYLSTTILSCYVCDNNWERK